jgi:hypothetical protein
VLAILRQKCIKRVRRVRNSRLINGALGVQDTQRILLQALLGELAQLRSLGSEVL